MNTATDYLAIRTGTRFTLVQVDYTRAQCRVAIDPRVRNGVSYIST